MHKLNSEISKQMATNYRKMSVQTNNTSFSINKLFKFSSDHVWQSSKCLNIWKCADVPQPSEYASGSAQCFWSFFMMRLIIPYFSVLRNKPRIV